MELVSKRIPHLQRVWISRQEQQLVMTEKNTADKQGRALMGLLSNYAESQSSNP